jgi:hypothetical protein
MVGVSSSRSFRAPFCHQQTAPKLFLSFSNFAFRSYMFSVEPPSGTQYTGVVPSILQYI